MHLSIIFIWGMFALTFFLLGCFHWRMANKSISHLQVKQLIPEGVEMQIMLGGVDFQEFINKFNLYIDYYNQTSKKQNKTQAFGYLLASFTAIASLAIAL